MIMRPKTTLTIPDMATQPHPRDEGMMEVNRIRVIPEKISAKASSKVSGVAASSGLRIAKAPAAPYKIALRASRLIPLLGGTRRAVPSCAKAPISMAMPTPYTDTVPVGGRLRNANAPRTINATPRTMNQAHSERVSRSSASVLMRDGVVSLFMRNHEPVGSGAMRQDRRHLLLFDRIKCHCADTAAERCA